MNEQDPINLCASTISLSTTLLLIADTRVRLGLDGDASVTVARLVGRMGELERLAALVRFVDAPADRDPTLALLRQMRGEVRRLSPLLSRLGPEAD